jgi:hypothetical protein
MASYLARYAPGASHSEIRAMTMTKVREWMLDISELVTRENKGKNG